MTPTHRGCRQHRRQPTYTSHPETAVKLSSRPDTTSTCLPFSSTSRSLLLPISLLLCSAFACLLAYLLACTVHTQHCPAISPTTATPNICRLPPCTASTRHTTNTTTTTSLRAEATLSFSHTQPHIMASTTPALGKPQSQSREWFEPLVGIILCPGKLRKPQR